MEFTFVVESIICGCHEYKTNIKCLSVPRIHGSMCASRYRWALDLIGEMLDWLSLSIEDNGTSLHKDPCGSRYFLSVLSALRFKIVRVRILKKLEG